MEQLLEYGENYDAKYIGHYNPEHSTLLSLHNNQLSSIMVIGPEGDFTQSEVSIAIKNNFLPVNISANRLRTETAGIVAISQLVSKKEL